MSDEAFRLKPVRITRQNWRDLECRQPQPGRRISRVRPTW